MLWRLLYVLPNFFAGFGMLVVAWLAWRHRRMRGGPVFFAMALSASLWAFCEGLSFVGLSSQTIKQVWQIQYFGVVSAPIFLAVFALQHVGMGHRLSWRAKLALSVYPALVLLAAWLPDWQHLVWARRDWDETTPFPTLASEHGPLVWLLLAYHYAMLAAVAVALWQRKKGLSPRQQRQVNLLLWAGAIPVLASGLYMARVVPLRNMDLAPLAFNFSVALLSAGVLRERIFSLIPVARHEVYQSLEDAVFVLDRQHAVVDINPAAVQLFGFDMSRISGLAMVRLLPAVQGLLSRGAGELEVESDGHWFNVRLSTLFSIENRAIGYLLVWRDVTRYKNLEAELKRLATIDSLTGLINHRQFCERGEHLLTLAQRNGRPISLLMMDLDHFKSINDRFGHQQGDAVLIAVADACRKVLRTSDVVGRLGGEEFAVLLPDTSSAAAEEAAARLLEAIRQLDFTAMPLQVTASIGIVSAAAESFDVLLGRADAALYRAKAEGRNRARLAEPAYAL